MEPSRVGARGAESVEYKRAMSFLTPEVVEEEVEFRPTGLIARAAAGSFPFPLGLGANVGVTPLLTPSPSVPY